MTQEQCVLGACEVVFLGRATTQKCVGGRGRKEGGAPCARCGVQRPVPLAKGLEKFSWLVGARFLSEHAELLAPAVQICVHQNWVEPISIQTARGWACDKMSLATSGLVNAGHLTQPVGTQLMQYFARFAGLDACFSYAYRGLIQDDILDCARRLSIELWRNGERPGIALRPGGEYYAYLHSLSHWVWVYAPKKEITFSDLCEAVYSQYTQFASRDKRLVFAFCLIREYARRLDRSKGKSSGLSSARQDIILRFIQDVATSNC